MLATDVNIQYEPYNTIETASAWVGDKVPLTSFNTCRVIVFNTIAIPQHVEPSILMFGFE